MYSRDRKIPKPISICTHLALSVVSFKSFEIHAGLKENWTELDSSLLPPAAAFLFATNLKFKFCLGLGWLVINENNIRRLKISNIFLVNICSQENGK